MVEKATQSCQDGYLLYGTAMGNFNVAVRDVASYS